MSCSRRSHISGSSSRGVRARACSRWLSELARRAGAGFALEALEAVDPDRQLIRTLRGELAWDALIVAASGRGSGAFTFRGPANTDSFARLLERLGPGAGSKLVFRASRWRQLAAAAVGTGLGERRPSRLIRDPRLPARAGATGATPLSLFGEAASAAVATLLRERETEVVPGVYPVEFAEGRLTLRSGRLASRRAGYRTAANGGPGPSRVCRGPNGFIPTDNHGRVRGLADVFAAGDITSSRSKQGGIAAQQADAAAEQLAAKAGAPTRPQPFSADPTRPDASSATCAASQAAAAAQPRSPPPRQLPRAAARQPHLTRPRASRASRSARESIPDSRPPAPPSCEIAFSGRPQSRARERSRRRCPGPW